MNAISILDQTSQNVLVNMMKYIKKKHEGLVNITLKSVRLSEDTKYLTETSIKFLSKLIRNELVTIASYKKMMN